MLRFVRLKSLISSCKFLIFVQISSKIVNIVYLSKMLNFAISFVFVQTKFVATLTIWHGEWFALENWQASCQSTLAHKLTEPKLFQTELKWEKWNKSCAVNRNNKSKPSGYGRDRNLRSETKKRKELITRTETSRKKENENHNTTHASNVT